MNSLAPPRFPLFLSFRQCKRGHYKHPNETPNETPNNESKHLTFPIFKIVRKQDIPTNHLYVETTAVRIHISSVDAGLAPHGLRTACSSVLIRLSSPILSFPYFPPSLLAKMAFRAIHLSMAESLNRQLVFFPNRIARQGKSLNALSAISLFSVE